MKLRRSSILEGILIIITIGVLFGAFRKFSGIPMFWPGVFLLFVYSAYFNPIVFIKPTLIWSYLLLFVLILFDLSGYFYNFPEVHLSYFGVFSLVFPYLLSALIIENIIALKISTKPILSNIGKIAIIIFILNSFFTIFFELLYPGATRAITRPGFPDWIVTHTFGAVYGLPFILAALIAFERKRKVIGILIFFVQMVSLLMAGFTTALVFSVLILSVGILIRYKIKNSVYYLGFLTIVLILASLNIDSILNLLPKLPNQAYSQKIDDLYLISQGAGGQANIRGGVYNTSVNTFLNHIWFGSGEWKETGEHSYWLDRLAFLGILGTFFFFMTLFSIYKRSVLLLPKDGVVLFNYLILLLFVLLFFNPFYNFDFWLIILFYLPATIHYYQHKNQIGHKTT